MKKMMFTLFAMLTIAATASAMSYEQARNEALFLTDKMAYELNLTDDQYEAAYEINLDYLMGVTSRYDVFGPYWERRNLDLSYILFSWQWDMFRAATYFYRPLYWNAGYWHFGIYARYPHRDYFYFGRPHFYASYRGGHSWRMNGGRSWYEHRRDFYRPAGRTHDSHVGMRNGFDRGDYRGGRVAGGSSTRHNQGLQDQNRGSFGSNRNGGNRNNNYQGDTRQDNRSNGQGMLGGSRQDNGTRTRGSFEGGRLDNGVRNNNGNFGGSRRTTTPSGTISRQNQSTTRSVQVAPQVRREADFSSQRSANFSQQRTAPVRSERSVSGSTFGGSRSSAGSSSVRSSAPTRSSSAGRSGGAGGSRSGGGHGNFGGSRR